MRRVALALSLAADLGAQAAIADSTPIITRELDSALTALERDGVFSGAVLLAHEGTPLLSRAAGQADREQGRANTIETRLGVASIGKLFTAVAIGQLIDAGRVALSDTVGRFLPDYPNAQVRRRVTVEQLLTHQSGLGSYFNERYEARRTTLWTLRDHLPLFESDSLLSPPGTHWNYSNAGFILLGRIVEQASGQDYFDYLAHRVFAPAGMRNTGFYGRDGRAVGDAIGYDTPEDSATVVHPNLAQRERRGAAAGGGYSTAGDLVRFFEALRTDRLLSAALRRQLTTGRVQEGGGRTRYGLGMSVRSLPDGGTAWGHTGGFPGIAAQAFHFEAAQLSLVVLLNRTGPRDGEVLAVTGRAATALALCRRAGHCR